jgi:small subunit ribosomal protein S2
MAEVGLRELLEAGVHFGHQTRRWNPHMRRYIHGERDGIHVIDLLQTQELLAEAQQFASDAASKGGTVLFVGTKKQARDAVKEWADRSEMPYVNQRWLGGLLTNFATISKRIDRLHELTSLADEGQLELLPTKERMSMQAELAKLDYNLGGVRDMKRLPQAVVIIDLKTEEIALREAKRLRIPIIGLVDTNCDPAPVDFVIPGNDDAIRSCGLVVRAIGESVTESASAYRAEEQRRRAAEEAERQRREEEQRRREEEERARQEAEEAAAKEAAAQQATEQGAEAPARGGEAAAPAPKGEAPAETGS